MRSDSDEEAEDDELGSLPSQTPQRAPVLRREFMTPQLKRELDADKPIGRLSLGGNTQGPTRIFAQPQQNWKVSDIVVPSSPAQPAGQRKKARESVSNEERKVVKHPLLILGRSSMFCRPSLNVVGAPSLHQTLISVQLAFLECPPCGGLAQ